MKRPKSTVLSVQTATDPDVLAWCRHVRDGLTVKNLLLHKMPFGVQETAAFMVANDERYTYQLLPDLQELVGELLPHEFEHLLGSLLSLAATTFVAIPLPDTRFFSYWGSAEELIAASAAAVAKLTGGEFHIDQKAFETGGSNGGLLQSDAC